MQIGLMGGAATVEQVVEQAQAAEAQGFQSLWFASGVLGDPVAAMVVAGRGTSSIELGTAVLQTYPCHPVLQANRIAAAAAAMGRPGFTLGIGPSHGPTIEGTYGFAYDHPGRSTEEYLTILCELLRGNPVEHEGQDWTARAPAPPIEQRVPVLVAALGPRLLRVAGELADGVVLWMAPHRAVAEHVVPRLHAAAAAAGRPRPRVVAGLPVAVHDDEGEAREAVARTATVYEGLPNYRRVLALGGVDRAADAAIVGDEASVERQLRGLVDVGATDVQAFVVPVGDDRAASRRRTTELLASLVG